MIDPQHQSRVAAADGRQGVSEVSANGFEDLADLVDLVPQALIDRGAQARELIRAHPLPAVLGALALGFIAARLIRED